MIMVPQLAIDTEISTNLQLHEFQTLNLWDAILASLVIRTSLTI